MQIASVAVVKSRQSQWAREQDEVETEVSLPDRIAAFRKHGDFSMAWSTVVQPLLSHVGDAEGYVAFRQRWNQTIALGDPVCHADQAESLLARFIDSHHRPSFIQISQPIAAILSRHGYRINQIGLDTTVDLQKYDFKGKQKEWLRYAANWTSRRGFEIRECSFNEVSDREVEAVSEAWRKTRTVKSKEVRFLNRPIVLRDEPDVRKFFPVRSRRKGRRVCVSGPAVSRRRDFRIRHIDQASIAGRSNLQRASADEGHH